MKTKASGPSCQENFSDILSEIKVLARKALEKGEMLSYLRAIGNVRLSILENITLFSEGERQELITALALLNDIVRDQLNLKRLEEISKK